MLSRMRASSVLVVVCLIAGGVAAPVWAVAGDGADWQSVAGHDQLLAALAQGYICHDFYVQQIWNEFHDVLAEPSPLSQEPP